MNGPRPSRHLRRKNIVLALALLGLAALFFIITVIKLGS